MDARQVIIRPVVSEKSYALMADGKYTFRVHERRQQDADRARRSRRSSASSVAGVRTAMGQAQAEAPRPHQRHTPRAGRRRSSSSHPATRSSCSRAQAVASSDGNQEVQSRPRPGAASRPTTQREELTKTEPEKALTEGRRSPAGATRTAASPRATAAAGPSAATARSTSSAARTACRRRSRRSSTTRTAPALHRAAPLRRRREALHPRARSGSRSATRSRPGADADIAPGNALPLARIPTGTIVHNVELTPGQGGQLGRSAGTAIQLVAKEGR